MGQDFMSTRLSDKIAIDPTEWLRDSRLGAAGPAGRAVYLDLYSLAVEYRNDGLIGPADNPPSFRQLAQCVATSEVELEQAVERLIEVGLVKWRGALLWVGRIPAVVRSQWRRGIPQAVRNQVFERDGWLCIQCGSGDHLHLDHKRPYSRGGSDEINNLQTLCRTCNLSKGARY